MRPFLVAAVLLATVPAFAQQSSRAPAPRVVVDRDPVMQRLGSVDSKLTEALRLLGRSRRDRQVAELLEAMHAELLEVGHHVANAPLERAEPQPPAPQPPSRHRPSPYPAPTPYPTSPPTPQPYPAPSPYPPPGRPAVQPMADATLQALLGAIQKESFSENRLDVLQQAMASHYVLVSQVQQLLPLYTFSADRLKALRLLKPRILDPENSFKLSDSFTFSSDKQEMMRILAQ